MGIGHNFDFESYCIVGEIAGNFRNVYAETSRYNYGPIFLCLQGTLYRISQINQEDWVKLYRVLIVSVLTIVDLGITKFISKRYSTRKALMFFLNPISIIITGYHNQFDNIAILLSLLAIPFYNEHEKIEKKDFIFVALLTFSLMSKHILFIYPVFLLLRKGLPLMKKILYVCVPPLLFLLSFLPFAATNAAGFQGIINNVFLYRSFNNAPLLFSIHKFIGFPGSLMFIIYIVSMIVVAIISRNIPFEKQLYIYFISMVAFSSAIANQYLVIPMVALCVLNTGSWKSIYMLIIGGALVLEENGLGVLCKVPEAFPGIIEKIAHLYVVGRFILAAWILFFTLLYLRTPTERKILAMWRKEKR